MLLNRTSKNFPTHLTDGTEFWQNLYLSKLSCLWGANRRLEIRTSLNFGKGEENNPTSDKSTSTQFTFRSTRQEMNLRCSPYYFCCWKVTYITLSLNLGVRWGRTRMSCDFINNQIICSIQRKPRDGTISSASIDSVLYAAKWMLTVLRGCAKAGQVTCLMHDISLECTVRWQRDTKQGWRACVLNILIDMQASSRATPFPCKLKSLPGNWASPLNRSLPEQTGRWEKRNQWRNHQSVLL